MQGGTPVVGRVIGGSITRSGLIIGAGLVVRAHLVVVGRRAAVVGRDLIIRRIWTRFIGCVITTADQHDKNENTKTTHEFHLLKDHLKRSSIDNAWRVHSRILWLPLRFG
jgi:hypothetical protein